MCLDLPLLTSFDKDFVRQAVLTVGNLQVYSHFGGEFFRDEWGQVQQKGLDFGNPLPDYAYFIRLMHETGYDGYFGYELCHPVLNDAHEPLGIAAVDEQVRLAREFMGELIK
jgi:sugar phosphate isomerase/epimerase